MKRVIIRMFLISDLPFGKLPLLEDEEGRKLHQSLAIARYVAANTDLLPSDPWEQALLDAAVLTVYDMVKRKFLMFVLSQVQPAGSGSLCGRQTGVWRITRFILSINVKST